MKPSSFRCASWPSTTTFREAANAARTLDRCSTLSRLLEPSMPPYKVHPASIPKHLRIPRPLKTPATTLKPSSHPPSALPSATSSPSVFSSTPAVEASDIWFSLPRFRVGLPQFRARRAAEHHPVAKLRDPVSLRVYDFVVRASIPALLVYFVWWAPGGEQSDIAVVSTIHGHPTY
jgi:hypothetical protein